ncbi:MAG: hypothetical protein JXR37_33075 [Kiritimatiellae bacterium]|nr:hypothetical protein [Kiritimatiellia bacterium]
MSGTSIDSAKPILFKGLAIALALLCVGAGAAGLYRSVVALHGTMRGEGTVKSRESHGGGRKAEYRRTST